MPAGSRPNGPPVNAQDLRSVQAPLKERYRENPGAALITLRAQGRIGEGVSFQNIRLQFTLDTDASEEQLATLLRLTERYCVVYQTLAHPPTLVVTRRLAGT
jgi:uncharacterized OsmC-like protein